MAREQKSDKFAYVLDWIHESVEARRAQNALVERTIKAYQGDPAQNYYKKSVYDYAATVGRTDTGRGRELKAMADDIPEKRNMTLHNAVETVVSMAQGGVGRYEFGPYDPEMEEDDKVIDMLSSAAQHFYNCEKVDSVMPQYIRAAVLSGASYFHLKQKDKRKVLTMLDSSQVLTDPKRMKTNVERFIGYHQRESWRSIRDRTTKNKGGLMLKSLNEVDVYLSQVLQELNGVLDPNPANAYLHEELRKDIDIFYQPFLTQINEARKQDPTFMFNGDEVEIAYIYDMMNDMYFEVINRRYIVVGKSNPLTRSIKCSFVDMDGKTVNRTKQIELDNPMIELPFLKTFWDTYPISPLFYVLDDFDSLCAMESVLYHNLSIMAPISFIGQSSDAEKVARASQVSGEIIEGLPQTFGILNKDHDVSSTIAAIQRYEDRIKRIIGATDPFEMQAMLGDRASAKEVSSMTGQIAQRLNPFVANIETAMATLGDKFIKLHLILNDGAYSFTHNGKYAELEPESMAGDYEIQAKLVSSIKLEQAAQSQKALELIQYLGNTDKIEPKEFFSTLLPIVLSGVVSRSQADKMISDQYRPMPEEVISRIKKNAEYDAKRSDIDKLDFSNMSNDELDQAIKNVSAVSADPNAYFGGNPDTSATDPSIAAAVQQGQPGATPPEQVAPPLDMSQLPPDVQPPAPQVNSSPAAAGEQANNPDGQMM